MHPSAPAYPKPAWLLNMLGLLLALGISGVLLHLTRLGPPDRATLAGLLALVLVTPVLLRWQTGWMVLFLFFPLVSFLRRVYALMLPDGGWEMNDPMILLPDALMGLMALSALLTMRWRKREAPLIDDRLLRVPIALLFGLCVIQIFNPFMGSLPAGFNGFRQFTLWFLLFFLTPIVIQKKRQIYAWILVTLLLGAGTGIYGAYQYAFGFPEYDQAWAIRFGVTTQTIGEQMRAFSTFGFTSTFSHYMLIAACMGLGALKLREFGGFMRILSPFFLGCALTGLAFTFVRSSYLGLIVAVVIGIISGGRPDGRWKRLLAVFLVTAALISALPHHEEGGYQEGMSNSQLVTERVLTLASPAEVGSMGARFGAWEKVLKNSATYPVGLGLGAGGASRFNGNHWLSAMAYTESQYFSMLAELGWPGFLLFIWLTLYGLYFTLKVHDRLNDPELKRVARICLMLQVGILVTGVTGGPVLFNLPGSAYYWASLGLVVALPRLDAKEA